MTIALQESASYTGGFFLQGSGKAFVDRKFLQLGRGDLCIFQYDLCHGVDVQEGSHLELVLHFKDSPQAVADGSCPWYSKMVEVGDPDGLFGHALSLVKKDFPAAKEFVEKACEQDHVEALYTAAEWRVRIPLRLWSCGVVPPSWGIAGQGDIWEGKRLLRLAFEQDDPDAAFHLGQALLQDGDRDGVTKLLAACAKGHPRACFQVAELYREGQFQFPKDLRQSVRYTKWAAHQGDAQALSNLGHLLINGIGVVKDEAKAVRLFRHAAKLGAAEGMLNYGLALLRGSGGVKVDYQEALEWAQKSAALGHSLAHQQLSTFFNAAKNPNPPARCNFETFSVWKALTFLTASKSQICLQGQHYTCLESLSLGMQRLSTQCCWSLKGSTKRFSGSEDNFLAKAARVMESPGLTETQQKLGRR
eukprot:g14812.t1